MPVWIQRTLRILLFRIYNDPAMDRDLSLHRLTSRFIHFTKVEQPRLMMPGKRTYIRGKVQTVGDILGVTQPMR